MNKTLQQILEALGNPRNTTEATFEVSYCLKPLPKENYKQFLVFTELTEVNETTKKLWKQLSSALERVKPETVIFSPPKVRPLSSVLHLGVFAVWISKGYVYLSTDALID
jgi:hypothetical protein